MIQFGKYHKLYVTEKTQKGAYLSEQLNGSRDAFMPEKEMKDAYEVGDVLEVFVYNDAKGRGVATLKRPKIVLGELAPLKVVSINHIGAFLEWGLDKDLFMPFSEQVGRIHKGETHLVAMYEDKSGRLCATMKVYDLLACDPPYKINDVVEGTIYSIKEAYGAFVAVENKYHGMIPLKELYGDHKIGSTVSVRIRKIREDGKLELSLRKTTHLQMEDDARKIMDALEENDGMLPLNDKSAPEAIKKELEMSKAAFKRAVGRLLKEGALEITEQGIKRNW